MAKNGDCRVISIQSHVVAGYVGNKSATFPLQVSMYCKMFGPCVLGVERCLFSYMLNRPLFQQFIRLIAKLTNQHFTA